MDIFKNTYHWEIYRNENYEMTFEVPDFFGPGFWSNKETGVWGIGDQPISKFILFYINFDKNIKN